MLSLEECAPKRPPRWQKLPLASGTVQFDTIIGRFSIEMSANHTICRASWHSFRIDSSTIMTMSRLPPSLSLANSAIGICSIGKVVCAPFHGDIMSRADLGGRRLSGVGSFGPFSSFSRSTICRTPPLLVP